MPVYPIVSPITGRKNYRAYTSRPGLKQITKTFSKKKNAPGGTDSIYW